VHINSNLNAHSYGKSKTESEPFLGSVAIQFLLGIGVGSLYTPTGGGNSGSINGYLYNTLSVTAIFLIAGNWTNGLTGPFNQK